MGLILLLTGCYAPKMDVDAPILDGKIVVTDQRGRDVEIVKPIEKIVAVPMPMASLVYTIDGTSDRLVGMHPSALSAIKSGILGKIEPKLASVSSSFVGNDFVINVEEALKTNPDLVLQWGDRGEDLILGLENVGIPTVGLKYGTQQDLETWIRILGTVLDRQDRADKLLNWHETKLTEVKNLTKDLEVKNMPRVLYLSPVENLRTVGSNTYNDEYFGWTGAINVAESLDGWNELTMEQVLAWNPDIIYVGNFGKLSAKDILANKIPGQKWQSVKAVIDGQVYDIPNGGYRWDSPSQESPLMWMWLFGVQYPEIDKFDLKDEMTYFYREFYNYEINEDDIRMILRCDSLANSKLDFCK